MIDIPNHIRSDIDIFADHILADPYPAFTELRDLGPAAFLNKYNVWHIGRFQETARALRDWQTFSSGAGCGLNDTINTIWNEALICEDPPIHTEKRKLFNSRLSPAALKPVEDIIDARSEALVNTLLEKGDIDIVKDIAQDLPIHVVMDLIGWPEDVRPHLLDMGAHSLNSLGPDNPRTHSTFPKLEEIANLCNKVYEENTLTKGGFGHTVAEAARAGHLPREAVTGLLAGYVVAAFDTTISGISSGCWLFGQHPDEWDKLRKDPSLVKNAFTEILRLESPIQHFARLTTKDVDMGEGITIPKGSRVIVSYAAANRDERQFQDPDTFDITRPPKPTLSFSAGPHTCAGQGLARLEANAVFKAMAKRIRKIEITGEPVRALDNITRGFDSIPARIVARAKK